MGAGFGSFGWPGGTGGSGGGSGGSIRLIKSVTVLADVANFQIASGLAALAADSFILKSRLVASGSTIIELRPNNVASNISNTWEYSDSGGVFNPNAITVIYLAASGSAGNTLCVSDMIMDAKIGFARSFEGTYRFYTTTMLRASRQQGYWGDTTTPLDSFNAVATTSVVKAGSEFDLFGVFTS